MTGVTGGQNEPFAILTLPKMERLCFLTDSREAACILRDYLRTELSLCTTVMSVASRTQIRFRMYPPSCTSDQTEYETARRAALTAVYDGYE